MNIIWIFCGVIYRNHYVLQVVWLQMDKVRGIWFYGIILEWHIKIKHIVKTEGKMNCNKNTWMVVFLGFFFFVLNAYLCIVNLILEARSVKALCFNCITSSRIFNSVIKKLKVFTLWCSLLCQHYYSISCIVLWCVYGGKGLLCKYSW